MDTEIEEHPQEYHINLAILEFEQERRKLEQLRQANGQR